MSTKKQLTNQMTESIGRVQQSLGITPNKEQAEILNRELQKFIESYMEYRSIVEIKSENDDDNLVLRY